MEGGDANIAAAFHEEYQRLYHDFLLELFDAQYAEQTGEIQEITEGGA